MRKEKNDFLAYKQNPTDDNTPPFLNMVLGASSYGDTFFSP